MKKVLSMILALTLILSLTSSILFVNASAPQTPEPSIVLEEYEKLIASYVNETAVTDYRTTTTSQPSISYPADYAGAYYGDDGYLHINITSSLDNVDFYTDIVNESVTRFHIVDYTYTYLKSIHEILKPYMEDFDIYEISTLQADNRTYIYTCSSDHVVGIESVLANASVDPGSFDIIVEENSITTVSGYSYSEEPTAVAATSYFRPGDVVYNWSNGYAITWATVLCNAKKLVDGSYVYGFITAGHLWWDCTSAGNASGSMATKTQSTIDYDVDATFIPFNNTSYGTTSKISNSSLYTSSNYMGYYATVGTGFENYTCRAFGKSSGEHDDVTVITCDTTFRIKDVNTQTIYTITGIKTSGYSSDGDSGGPVVYDNSSNNYTLLGMTSARQTSGDYDNYIVPVCDIFSALGVTMVGGNY